MNRVRERRIMFGIVGILCGICAVFMLTNRNYVQATFLGFSSLVCFSIVFSKEEKIKAALLREDQKSERLRRIPILGREAGILEFSIGVLIVIGICGTLYYYLSLQ
jgi:hypothetical protein